jgi:hypothetical protein
MYNYWIQKSIFVLLPVLSLRCVLPSSQQAPGEICFETRKLLGRIRHMRGLCCVTPCTTIVTCFQFIFYHFAPSWCGHLNPMMLLLFLWLWQVYSPSSVFSHEAEHFVHYLLQGLIYHISQSFLRQLAVRSWSSYPSFREKLLGFVQRVA